MKKLITVTVLSAMIGVFALATITEAKEFGMVWYEGQQVRTFGVPSAMPHEGTDPLYRIPGSGGVAGVAPGEVGFHGGAWQVWDATWNVTPYPLTSEQAVLDAAAAGHITLTRNADADFRCPIQP